MNKGSVRCDLIYRRIDILEYSRWHRAKNNEKEAVITLKDSLF